MMIMRWGAAGLLVAGLAFAGGGVWRMASYLDLVDEGVATEVIYAWQGDEPHGDFMVDGRRISCSGHFEVGETVVYDPDRPRRCRPAWAVGGFDVTDSLLLSLGGAGVLLGIVVWVFEHFAGRDDELDALLRGEEPPPR